MISFIRKYIIHIALFIILVLGGFMRFYKLDKIPPSLNWDEVAAGYNAYTIASWGRDEYGNKFPLVFKSFGDDKHPVHIYLTALIVKLFGSNDFTTRASSATIGTLSILVIYLLTIKVTGSKTAGLFSALFLAVSPYSIHFSRSLWEANFAPFFLMLGLVLFYKNIPLSLVAFGLSFFSYHSSKVVVPIVVFFLILFNLQKFFDKKTLAYSFLVASVFGFLILMDPRILGFARINQTKFSEELISKSGGYTNLLIKNYKQYFDYNYLFKTGDQSPRGSVKVVGEFYKLDLILSIIGMLYFLLTKRKRYLFLLLIWLLVAPIPAVLSSTDTNANRAIFMFAPFIILSGAGASYLLNLTKNKFGKFLVLIAILSVLAYEAYFYVHYYFNEYAKKNAIEWQYGMKEIVNFTKKHQEYSRIYVDKIRQQPYIFFLYYLKYPLPKLLDSVKYDESESKSYNTVSSFGRFKFGGWNIVESYPSQNILYAITPSYYSGLRYLDKFDVKLLIKYLDKSDAFYLVEGQEI